MTHWMENEDRRFAFCDRQGIPTYIRGEQRRSYLRLAALALFAEGETDVRHAIGVLNARRVVPPLSDKRLDAIVFNAGITHAYRTQLDVREKDPRFFGFAEGCGAQELARHLQVPPETAQEMRERWLAAFPEIADLFKALTSPTWTAAPAGTFTFVPSMAPVEDVTTAHWMEDYSKREAFCQGLCFPLYAPLPEGQRHAGLWRAAHKLFASGEKDVLGALRILNNRRCEVPLVDKEIRRIADGVAKRARKKTPPADLSPTPTPESPVSEEPADFEELLRQVRSGDALYQPGHSKDPSGMLLPDGTRLPAWGMTLFRDAVRGIRGRDFDRRPRVVCDGAISAMYSAYGLEGRFIARTSSPAEARLLSDQAVHAALLPLQPGLEAVYGKKEDK